MKTPACLSALLFLAIGLVSHARADSLDDKLKSFNDAIRADQASKNPGMEAMMNARLLPALGNSDMPGGEANLEASVRQLMATDPSPEVQRTGQAVLDAIESRRKERLQAESAKVDAVLAGAPDILNKAQKPADLDGLLGDLQSAMPTNAPYGIDGDIQPQVNRLNNAYQLVSQWQDYLATRDSNPQEALNTLRNLSNNRQATEPNLIPRSEILAKISELEERTKPAAGASPYSQPSTPDFAPILDSIKTLDDLAPAVQKVPTNWGNQSFFTAQLAQFATLYADAKNGLSITLDLNPPNFGSGTAPPGMERVKSMLLLYLLPRYLGIAAPAPNPDETVAAYLDRATTMAESKQDWLLLQRIIEAREKVAHSPNASPASQSFFAGLDQEIAGQYALAVGSYETALRQPDDFTPAAVIGDRLAAIKKDHPAEFDEGMKRFLNPPAPSYVNPYAARLGYPYAMPGYPVPGTMPSAVPAPAAISPSPNPPTATPHTNAPSSGK